MRRLLTSLEPRWFTAVMGTGILAVGGAQLTVPGARVASWGFLALAAVLLVLLLVGSAGHWLVATRQAVDEVRDSGTRAFAGAPPIALLVVSAGVGALTPDLGWLAVGLWVVGTLVGLATAVTVPLSLLADGELSPSVLLPVAPPVVAASTGAPLLARLPDGQPRLTGLLVLLGLTGASLLVAALLTVLVVARASRDEDEDDGGGGDGGGSARGQSEPAVWIVLGTLAQGTSALSLLGARAPALTADRVGAAVDGGAVAGAATLLAVLLWGTGALVLVLVVALTVRELRAGLGFGLSWWSFTFPLGSTVVASSALAVATGSAALRGAAAVLWLAALLVWLGVAAGTVLGVARGRLLPTS